MPRFSATRSVSIKSPVENVYRVVLDFNTWSDWSPWLIAEPGCPVEVSEDGQTNSWDGKIVGSGTMEIVEVSANERIDYKLTFLKPWKSESSVSFTFASDGGETVATWSMNGSLPFFLFWMKRMMAAWVGMDYQRGLGMLKDYIETGSSHSRLDFKGSAAFQGSPFVGIRNRCPIPDLGESMDRDFQAIARLLEERGTQPCGKRFSIYHEFNMVKGEAEYTSGIPVERPLENLPDGTISDDLPSCETYRISHTGPYRHLGNPWSAGMMHSRAKVFKQSKKRDPFEVYENLPGQVHDNELETTVHFPIG